MANEKVVCNCRFVDRRDSCGNGFCDTCGFRYSTRSDCESTSLKELSRAFLDQPFDLKQAESKGWPGPYVEYTDTDIKIWDTLSKLERELFPELFTPTCDDERDHEGP